MRTAKIFLLLHLTEDRTKQIPETAQLKRKILQDMIEYIKGELTEITPAMAVVECNGIGYGINISLNTFSAIQGEKNTKLFIYEAIREDTYALYGFLTKQERELFLLLIAKSIAKIDQQ